MEDEASVVGLIEIERSFQDEVQEIAVLVKAKAEKRGVNMLEVFDGGKAFENAFLDFNEFRK